MKIRELAIDGFGVWSDLRLAGFDDGINVIHGANEAGKTTLLQFLRTILYGFTPDRRERYLPPVHGGRAGGEVTIATSDGPVRVRRHAVDNADSSVAGAVEIVAPAEASRDERMLARLLGNVDEAVYRNVFAVGLREIQELGTLNDTTAAAALYNLATGLDRVSLVEVLNELAKARQRLLSAQADSTIVRLLATRDRLRQAAHGRQAADRYAELVRKRGELSARIATWDTEAANLERTARIVEVASSVHDKWQSRQAVDRDLAALRRGPEWDQAVFDRFEALGRARKRGKRRRRHLAAQLADNRQAIDALGLNPVLARHAGRIEAILEQEPWITALDAERHALAERIATREADRAKRCAQLGIEPTAAPREASRETREPWRLLKPLVGPLVQARDQLRQAAKELAERQQSADAASRELATLLTARGGGELTALMQRSGELVSQLRRRVQIDERIAEMSRRHKELEERARHLTANLLLPGWAVVALGVIFVAGVVALLAGLFLPSSLVGNARWALASLGFFAAAGAGGGKFLIEHSRHRRAGACRGQQETLGRQLKEATAERDRLDEQLPQGGGPLLARMQAAEKEHAALEALLPSDAKRQAAAQTLEAVRHRHEAVRAEYRQCRRYWRDGLATAGLPPGTLPARARQVARSRAELADLDHRLSADREELARRDSTVTAFHERLANLQADLNLPTAEAELAERFRALREALREQASLAAQRGELARHGRRLRARRDKARAKLRGVRRKLDALLDRAKVADAGELRRKALQAARGDLLSRQRETLSQEIAALRGPQFTEEEIGRVATEGTRQELDDRWLELGRRAADLRQEIKEAHEQLGRWQQETQALADDRRHGDALVELAAIERQLKEATDRWRTLAAAEWFLQGIRKTYERDRQPETLREASRYLARMTGGRYTRVWTPLDEDVLRVDHPDGESLPVAVLSRGTREQLFLSLRLALVTSYQRRGIDLPLVLDDVLVNFDAGRARIAAELLRDFAAAGHQLLVFTCHQHIYDLFRSLGVSARELPPHPRQANADEPPLVPASEPTNGRHASSVSEHPAADAVEPAAVAKPRRDRGRAHVKFDLWHGPRGPFAAAIWHERVADEPAVDGIDAEADDSPEEWPDVTAADDVA
ncbi:MAG: AAA family ATPase [Planctomycetia bacterium]|nr:AAA family ATPase [Planctomycetia bacterium]